MGEGGNEDGRSRTHTIGMGMGEAVPTKEMGSKWDGIML